MRDRQDDNDREAIIYIDDSKGKNEQKDGAPQMLFCRVIFPFWGTHWLDLISLLALERSYRWHGDSFSRSARFKEIVEQIEIASEFCALQSWLTIQLRDSEGASWYDRVVPPELSAFLPYSKDSVNFLLFLGSLAQELKARQVTRSLVVVDYMNWVCEAIGVQRKPASLDEIVFFAQGVRFRLVFRKSKIHEPKSACDLMLGLVDGELWIIQRFLLRTVYSAIPSGRLEVGNIHAGDYSAALRLFLEQTQANKRSGSINIYLDQIIKWHASGHLLSFPRRTE